MNTDEQDELWELLGKVRKTKVSPFFARNILREIRIQKTGLSHFFAWFSYKIRLISLTASTILLVGAGIATFSGNDHPIRPQSMPLIATVPDLETLNHLDELLAYEENSTWLDNSSY